MAKSPTTAVAQNTEAVTTMTVEEIKTQQERLKEAAAKIKAETKAVREAETKAAAAKRAKLAKVREEVQAELAAHDADIASAKAQLDRLKEQRVTIVARLPKGTRGTGSGTPVAKRDGLTKPQERILEALSRVKPGGALTRQEISERTSVSEGWVVGFTGKACADNRTPSLVEQGLAEEVTVEGEEGARPRRCWKITKKGLAALRQLAKGE